MIRLRLETWPSSSEHWCSCRGPQFHSQHPCGQLTAPEDPTPSVVSEGPCTHIHRPHTRHTHIHIIKIKSFLKKRIISFVLALTVQEQPAHPTSSFALDPWSWSYRRLPNPLATSVDSGNHSSPLEEQQVLPTNALSLQLPISFLKFCTLHACRACGSLQRASDALELEL